MKQIRTVHFLLIDILHCHWLHDPDEYRNDIIKRLYLNDHQAINTAAAAVIEMSAGKASSNLEKQTLLNELSEKVLIYNCLCNSRVEDNITDEDLRDLKRSVDSDHLFADYSKAIENFTERITDGQICFPSGFSPGSF